MPPYQPFPIYDVSTGLYLAKEPWLAPRDAFVSLLNARIYQGKVVKRRGTTLFGDLGSGLPVTGIYEYYDSQGSKSLLVFDTKSCYQYFPLTDSFGVIASNLWTGEANDFMWAENWADRMFVTNNVDQIKQFDGSSFTDLVIDFDGDGLNDVNTALLIFNYKQRLLILRPTEKGYLYPQRVRWSAPGSWSDWTNDGYIDAPTLDWIVSAAFLGDDLIVFFERSIWALRYLGDPDLPFVWKKLVETEGSYATFSTTEFSDEILTLGPTGLISTDGFDATRVDEDKIPDIALDIDQEHYDLCYGAVLEEDREFWMTFPSIGSTKADRVLVLNYASNAWSIYDLSIHSIGYWETAEDPTLDQIDQSWDELEIIFDEPTAQAGYPITLGGTYDGRILRMNDSGADLGAPIKFEVKTGRWNPFIEQGLKARLGRVDFLFTTDPGITVNVDFYTDFSTTPYATHTLTLDGSGEKTWKTLHIGEEGQTHQIRIWHEAANQTIELHAIVPWFKPTGKLVG